MASFKDTVNGVLEGTSGVIGGVSGILSANTGFKSLSAHSTNQHRIDLQNSINSANAANVAATNAMNYRIAQETSAFNAAEAQKNRDFQLSLSNTAYQRAMADMKKAGLNPILAYQRGGASTPSGSMASGVNSAYQAAHGSAPSLSDGTDYPFASYVTEVANSAFDALKHIGKSVLELELRQHHRGNSRYSLQQR